MSQEKALDGLLAKLATAQGKLLTASKGIRSVYAKDIAALEEQIKSARATNASEGEGFGVVQADVAAPAEEPEVDAKVADAVAAPAAAPAGDKAGDKAAAPTEFNKNYITPFAKTLADHEALMAQIEKLKVDVLTCRDTLLAIHDNPDALNEKNTELMNLTNEGKAVVQKITDARNDLVGKKDAIAQLLSDFSNKATKFVDEKTKFDTHNTAQTGLKEARASKEAEVNAKKDALDQIAKPDSALEAVDAKFGKKFADFLETLLNKKYSEQQQTFADYELKNLDMDNKYKAEHKKLTDDYNAAAQDAKDKLEAAEKELSTMVGAAAYADQNSYNDAVTEFKQDADKLSTFDMTNLSDGGIQGIIAAIGDNHNKLLSGLTLDLADKDNFSSNANGIQAALVEFDTYVIATLGEVSAEVI